MKFTLSWLKDHLETGANLDKIIERLTMIGLEVERVSDYGDRLGKLKTAKILEVERHPSASHLRILKVDTGKNKVLQVVCGAPNARPGLIGVLGRPGDYIPGLDTTLSVSKIHGVESYGMMCSERELELSGMHQDIIDLPERTLVGKKYVDQAGMSDPLIEICLTPNRTDCASVYGIARDLAASGIGTLRRRPPYRVESSYSCPVDVKIKSGNAPPLCLAFSGRLIRGPTEITSGTVISCISNAIIIMI